MMKTIKKYMKLYKRLSAQSLKTLMEYKVDFLIGLSGFLVSQVIGILTLNIIFNQIPVLNGWNYNQVLLVYAMAQIPRGLDHMLADNLWLLSNRIIVRSEFDKYLLKPINPLFYLLAEKFQTDAFGELIIGICLLCYSVINLRLKITFTYVILFLVFIVCGTIIYTGIKLLFSSLAFWFKTSDGILGMVYSMSDFAKYPISIYPSFIRGIISFIIPFAFTAYFPAAYFLNKESVTMCVFGLMICTITISMISLKVWYEGIKVYEGAGN